MPRGRPKGSKQTRAVCEAQPSRCWNCRGTNRGRYLGCAYVLQHSGEHNGEPFNRIVRRRCQCTDCGMFRIDISYHFDPPE